MALVEDSIEEICERASNLPTISPVLIELINIIDDMKTTKRQVADLVSKDQVLCADIFKYLGSATFALRRVPKTIEEAIDYLGFDRLKEIVFLMSTKAMFTDVEHWYESVFIANTSRKLARLLNKPNAYCDDLYMAALLFSLGKLVFKRYYREHFDQVGEELSLNERLAQEDVIFGINHIELSYKTLEFSGLPPKVLDIIKKQQNTLCSEDYLEQNALIELASRLEKLDFAGEYEVQEAVDHDMLKNYALDCLEVTHELVQKLHEEVKDVVSLG